MQVWTPRSLEKDMFQERDCDNSAERLAQVKGGVTTGLVGTGGGWMIEVTVRKSGSSHPRASFSFMKSTAKEEGIGQKCGQFVEKRESGGVNFQGSGDRII